jgi:hypothetical protein
MRPPLMVKSPSRIVSRPVEKRRTVGRVSRLLWMSDASTTRSVAVAEGAAPPIPPAPERSSSRPAIERSDEFTRSEYFVPAARSACDWSRMRWSSTPEAK